MQFRLRPEPAGLLPRPVLNRKSPAYFFCIGAAKCGTTWLYDYMRAHPQCYLRGHKELNFFYAVEPKQLDRARDRIDRKIAAYEVKVAAARPSERASKTEMLLDMHAFKHVLATCERDPNAYFKYMMTGLKTERLVGDISPDYALLSAEALRLMVGVADETRFLYIMRDPVERLWSHARMDAKNKLPAGREFLSYAKELLAAAISGDPQNVIASHSQYKRTLTALFDAVPEERRLVLFYEDLMRPSGLRKLCAFLKIKPLMAGFDRQVNEGVGAELSAEDRAVLRRFLQPEYEYVAQHFPNLPDAWKKSMDEGFN